MRAVAAGAHKLTIPVSASRARSQANVRKSPQEAILEVRDLCQYVKLLHPGHRPGVEVAEVSMSMPA